MSDKREQEWQDSLTHSLTLFDNRLVKLETSYDSLASFIHALDKKIDTSEANTEKKLDELGNKLDQSREPKWGILIGFTGLTISIIITFSGMLINPLQKDVEYQSLRLSSIDNVLDKSIQGDEERRKVISDEVSSLTHKLYEKDKAHAVAEAELRTKIEYLERGKTSSD